jgi:hypothetical protein
MDGPQHDLSLCSHLVSPDELARYLELASKFARLSDLVANSVPLDPDELELWRDESSRHRDFRWSVLPGDKVWLTAEPPRHPEVEYGMPYLVVVRGGRVVCRYRLE